MASEEEVKQIFQLADCVCFDVDSTVCVDETIDELARYLGVGEEVANITHTAMRGFMSYKQSMIDSFSLIKPSQNDIKHFVANHPVKLTPNVSFVSLVEKVADALDIPKENIFANRLLFYYHGEFAGFDENQPTIRTGGKAKVIEKLKETHGYKRVVHIGDGVTDLEACPPADAFIGFGGVEVREKVKNGCHWFVKDMKELLDVLQQNDG